MNRWNAETIRNVGIVAHVDAGKTTTTEHMLFESGRIRSLGRVDAGTAQTDWLDVERERGISVRAAMTAFQWMRCAINLIDTPGHVDFSSEVERSLRILDGAILIVSAVEGVQAHTETLWNALRSLDIPTLIMINKLDRIGADTERVMAELKRYLSPDIVAVQQIFGTEAEFRAVDGLWRRHEDGTLVREGGVPQQYYDRVAEALAGHDEQLLEDYVSGNPIPDTDCSNGW